MVGDRNALYICLCLFVLVGSVALATTETEIKTRDEVAPREKKTSIGMALSLYGFGASASEIESRVVGTVIESDVKHSLTSRLKARLQAGVQLETGTARSFYNSEFEPRQTLILKETSLTATPLDFLTVRAGALDQNELRSPILFANQTFPAIAEEITLPFGKLKFALTAEQAYAADTQNFQSKARYFQQAASFFIERMRLSYTDKNNFEATLLASHFLFKNLSTQAAYQSNFLGNTVTGSGTASSRFASPFQGYEVGAHTTVRLFPWMNSAGQLSLLYNNRAPTDSNFGYWSSLKLEISAVRDFTISPSIAVFRIESDVSPALFTDRAYAHTNSSGYQLGIDLTIPSQSVQILIAYCDSKLLRQSPYESNLRWGQLSFRYQYEAL
jgi:hypothetical protein